MSLLHGRVADVQTIDLGEPATAAASIGATTLYVADASTFDEFGGMVSINDLPLAYSAIDVDLNTITMSAPLETAVAEQDMVYVFPPTPVKTATVELPGEGDSIPATVPHSLLDKLPDGMRTSDAGESVTLERRGSFEYVVTDVIAEPLTQTSLGYIESEEGIGLSENLAQFQDVAALGQIAAPTLSADSIILGGSDLQTQLDRASIGKLLSARLAAQGANIAVTTTATKVFELNCGTLPGGRTYRVSTSMVMLNSGALSINDRLAFAYRYTVDGTTPTMSSPVMDGGQAETNSLSGTGNTVRAEAEIDLASTSFLRVGFIADLISGAGSYSIYAGGATASRPVMTLYDDGPIGSRQDSAISLTGGGTARFTKTFNPTWGYGIQNANLATNPTYFDVGDNAYGAGAFGAFGFDSSAIVAALAGSTTPVSCVLRWRPRTRAAGTGLDVRFLSHNYSSASAFSTDWFPQQWDSAPANLTSLTTFGNAAPNQPYDQSLGTTLFGQFKTGSRRGIAIANSTVPTYNSHPDGTGTVHGFGAYQPQLIFTYDGTS